MPKRVLKNNILKVCFKTIEYSSDMKLGRWYWKVVAKREFYKIKLSICICYWISWAYDMYPWYYEVKGNCLSDLWSGCHDFTVARKNMASCIVWYSKSAGQQEQGQRLQILGICEEQVLVSQRHFRWLPVSINNFSNVWYPSVKNDLTGGT